MFDFAPQSQSVERAIKLSSKNVHYRTSMKANDYILNTNCLQIKLIDSNNSHRKKLNFKKVHAKQCGITTKRQWATGNKREKESFGKPTKSNNKHEAKVKTLSLSK